MLDIAQAPPRPPTETAGDPTGARVAVARDAAFTFLYPATMERLHDRATVTTFSPLAGDDLPPCDAIYLPGGYPELHAAALEDGPTLDAVAARAAEGTPILGECGGLMALSESLTTTDGQTYGMAGVLPADVRMHDRYRALDHVELRARRRTPTAAADDRLRGHEFHHSGTDARFAFDVLRGDSIDDDRDGLYEHRTLGTYCHCHAESGALDAFVERAVE